MKYTEINAIYTAKVAEMLALGYTINTCTMSGSQGEIAHIDFRKGEDVIRILITTDHDSKMLADQIVITVGRCTDTRVMKNTSNNHSATIWNQDLTVLEQRVFWIVSRRNEWFIEGDDSSFIEQALQAFVRRHLGVYPRLTIACISENMHLTASRKPLSKTTGSRLCV